MLDYFCEKISTPSPQSLTLPFFLSPSILLFLLLSFQLCRAMVDHVSDGFVDVATPLVLLCEAAQEGDRQLVEERAEMFVEHAKQLEKVGMKLCPSSFLSFFPSTSLLPSTYFTPSFLVSASIPPPLVFSSGHRAPTSSTPPLPLPRLQC